MAPFATKEACLDAARAYAATAHFGLRVRNSRERYVLLMCDRGGAYDDRQRHRDAAPAAPPRRGCSYVIHCHLGLDGTWRASAGEGDTGAHNHAPSLSAAAHPFHRRLTAEQETLVARLRAGNETPTAIHRVMTDQFPGACFTVKDVSNCIQRHRASHLDLRSAAQTLIEELRASPDAHCEYECAEDGALQSLLVASRDSIRLFRAFHDVLVLDCTYETNTYDMPLLQAIGITSVNTSFTAAVVFMPGEQEPDYEWALGALQRLLGDSFPRVVLTDRDQALMGALGTVLPHSIVGGTSR